MSKKFSHLDQDNQPAMVDVSSKQDSQRTATAEALVYVPGEVMELLDGDEITTPKGPVFQTAILAGIMGTKKTSDLIPLCHPLPLNNCAVKIEVHDHAHLRIICTAKVTGKTGVEMEALTGASVAALTIYDMCKAFSHDITIKEIRLLEKHGGKRDFLRE